MGFEHALKRIFPALVCLCLVFAAYFQARGMSALVSGELGAPASPTSTAKKVKHTPVTQPPRKSKSAQEIIARNVFDSVTGPLDGSADIHLPPPDPEPTHDTTDDRHAPPCNAGSVVLIAEGEDPAWSFAVIRAATGAKMRRVGDDVDGKHVRAILWDRVVLANGSDKCHLKVGSTSGSEPKRGALVQTESKVAEEVKKAGDKDKEEDAPKPVEGIKKVGENKYVIERATVEKLNLQRELTRNARVVANKGIRLTRNAKAGMLGQLGLNTNDIITQINGFDLADPDKAIQAYSRLKTSTSIQIQVDRGGAPLTVDVKIE